MSKILKTLFIFFAFPVWGAEFSQDVVQNTKRGVVSILAKIQKAAFNTPGESYGSGFIVDKTKGLICTNRHVVGSASIGRYEVTFFNGKQVDANVLYYDPIYDIAVLQVDPADIPSDANQLQLKPDEAAADKDVFLIGKNAGQDFSFQVGRITSLFETNGLYPAQAMRISLNTRGGSSGSAVCTKDGHVIGLIHSSNMDSYGFALWAGYLQPIIASLQKQEKPIRQSIGAIWSYYSLDRAIRYLEFPTDMAASYAQKFPESRNQMIAVSTTLNGSPAKEHLRAGDLIWKVNGQEVGPYINKIEAAMNQQRNQPIELVIVREGKVVSVTIPTYSLLKHQVRRIISFAGANIYESDELIRYLTGLEPRSVVISYVQPGTGLHQRFQMIPGIDLSYIKVLKIGHHRVLNFKDAKKAIQALVGQDFFAVLFENHGVWLDYDRWPILSKPQMIAEGDILETDGKPLLHVRKGNSWKTKELWSASTMAAGQQQGLVIQKSLNSHP